MGGGQRRLGRLAAVFLAATLALIAIAVLLVPSLPAPAAGSAQAEQLITIDGSYTGTYTVKTIDTPPEEAGSALTPGTVVGLVFELTAGSGGGGQATMSLYYEGTLTYTAHGSLTRDGNHIKIDLHSETGEEVWHFLGTATRTDDTVTISGTWSLDFYGNPTGVWEVTRPLSEEDSLGGASTSTSSPTTVPPDLEARGSETSESGEAAPGNQQAGSQGVFPEGDTSPAGVAVLILVVILALIATGMGVKEAVAEGLVAAMGSPKDKATPKVREAGPAVRALGRYLVGSDDMPVTVSGPVQPWSQPDTATPRAGFVLQPGGRYRVVASTGSGPDPWVLVRSDSAGVEGWVHRSALAPWQEEIPMVPTGTPPTVWERVHFPNPFRTRDPGGDMWDYEPGDYRLGPPDPNGYRRITNAAGKPLPGTIHASQVPPPPNQPTGGVPAAPPPPPPPPPH